MFKNRKDINGVWVDLLLQLPERLHQFSQIPSAFGGQCCFIPHVEDFFESAYFMEEGMTEPKGEEAGKCRSLETCWEEERKK